MPTLRWPPIVYAASGVLAEQWDLHPDEALLDLVEEARRSGVALVTLAEEVANQTARLNWSRKRNPPPAGVIRPDRAALLARVDGAVDDDRSSHIRRGLLR